MPRLEVISVERNVATLIRKSSIVANTGVKTRAGSVRDTRHLSLSLHAQGNNSPAQPKAQSGSLKTGALAS